MVLAQRLFSGIKILETDYFITEWTVLSTDTVVLPLSGTGYNFTVDWGDGSPINTITTYNDPNASHSYSSDGIYQIKILGDCPSFTFENIGSKLLITDVKQWGANEFISLNFWGCTNLNNLTPTDTPILSVGCSLESLFNTCGLSNINNIENWDISNVTTLRYSFNANIGFTIGDLSNWNFSNCLNFYGMFRFTSYNNPLNTATMKPTTMAEMFRNNSVFDQDLSGIDVSNLTNATFMFFSASLSTVNYNALLVAWNSQILQSGVVFHGGNSKYTLGSPAETAHANMIASDLWEITDGGGI